MGVHCPYFHKNAQRRRPKRPNHAWYEPTQIAVRLNDRRYHAALYQGINCHRHRGTSPVVCNSFELCHTHPQPQMGRTCVGAAYIFQWQTAILFPADESWHWQTDQNFQNGHNEDV